MILLWSQTSTIPSSNYRPATHPGLGNTSETSLSPALIHAFEDRVDLGFWAGFTSSLARFLDEVCGPPMQWGEPAEAAIDPSGGTLLLIVPFPMVKPEELVPQGCQSQLLARLSLITPPVPSLDLSGMVLVGRSDGIGISLPKLDAQGRALLDPTEHGILGATGWRGNHHVFTRLSSDTDGTVDLVTRILIEVFETAHPVDPDYLLRAHSDIS